MSRLVDVLTDEERELTHRCDTLCARLSDLGLREQRHEKHITELGMKLAELVAARVKIEHEISVMKNEKTRLVEDLRRKRQHVTWAQNG